MRTLKPLPPNLVQVEQSQIKAYEDKPVSDSVFSKNRGKDISRNNDKIKDISISIEDIDKSIIYYFENIVKPIVQQNGVQLKVPIIYGSAERWKAVQTDGYYRDDNDKLMAPLIMIKRTNIEKNRELGNKLDGNKVHNFQVFETRYNAKNQYDNFSILNNRQPSKQYYVSIVPDYVIITYECIIFTDYIEQNNKLIESIQFLSDSYWGDINRFHFRTSIDSFGISNILEQGENRVARTTISLKVNGYLIPENINKELAGVSMFYSPAQIVFDLEVVEDLSKPQINNMPTNIVKSTSFIGGGNNITNYNIFTSNVSSEDIIYLNTNTTVKGNYNTSSQILISNYNILAVPLNSNLPPTSNSNFSFFINGQYIPTNYILSIVNSGNTVLVNFNTTSMGYNLDTIDEVIGIGKFIAV